MFWCLFSWQSSFKHFQTTTIQKKYEWMCLWFFWPECLPKITAHTHIDWWDYNIRIDQQISTKRPKKPNKPGGKQFDYWTKLENVKNAFFSIGQFGRQGYSPVTHFLEFLSTWEGRTGEPLYWGNFNKMLPLGEIKPNPAIYGWNSTIMEPNFNNWNAATSLISLWS